MCTAPVWLLDFDGVINAISHHPLVAIWPKEDWRQTYVSTSDGTSWPVLVAEPVLAFIRDIHAKGLADIRWHSTWQEDAHRVSEALDLPLFPIEPAPECRYYTPVERWWKLPAAERVLDQGYRLLWTDDDINPAMSRAERTQLRATARCRLICPETRQGLTPKHLREISTYLSCVETQPQEQAQAQSQ